MPKYEKIRNERARRLERRNAETEQSRVWLFINSGIFLWVLSAILLTLGGGYVTTHQQCMRDADQIIERRVKLSQDLYARNVSFASRIASAKTLHFPIAPDKQGSINPDLSDISYGEVQHELWKINERVEKAELPDKAMQEAQLRWLNYNSSRADREYDWYREQPSSGGGADALKSAKDWAELQTLYDAFDRDLDILAYSYEPNCTVVKTFSYALGSRSRIVRAVISPLFGLGDTRIILKEDVDNIEERQRKR
jgi:hypothetical protein